MTQRAQKGFTLIELLVVIAIIGVLSTLAVVALNSAREKSRDSKRVADVKQIQTSLELFFADQSGYPVVPDGTPFVLGVTGATVLSQYNDDGASSSPAVTGWSDSTVGQSYMGLVPSAPIPPGTDCNATNNAYTYASRNATDTAAYELGDGTAAPHYTLSFCLGGIVGSLQSGTHTASPSGIQ